MTEEEFRTGKSSGKASKAGKALKDFHLFCPPHIDIMIAEGDDLAKIPEKFHTNLVTEGVMKG